MQGRALRVYFYNNLWHYFGNIPFYLKTFELHIPLLSWRLMRFTTTWLSSLESVIDSKVLPMRWDDKNCGGRMSQAMYLYDVCRDGDVSEWQDPLSKGIAVYAGNHQRQEWLWIMDDFASIWKESGEWCKESIWEVNYEDGNNERGWNSPLGYRWYNIAYLDFSKLLARWRGLGQRWWRLGSGFLPVKTETYDMYGTGDKRRDATIWDCSWWIPERYQDTGLSGWLNIVHSQRIMRMQVW